MARAAAACFHTWCSPRQDQHHVIAISSSHSSLPPSIWTVQARQPYRSRSTGSHNNTWEPRRLPSLPLYPVPPPTISNDMLAAKAMNPGTTSPATHSICLLSGTLGEFLRYSRQEASKWLIDLAHDICDPANLRGSLLVWKEPQQQWRPVANTDPLTASIYRYDLPVGITVGLSKISHRVRKSVTTATGNASTMADRVKRRDEECWVTAIDDPPANSHICPKRMGDHIGRIVFRTFTSLAPAPNLSIYDEIFGLSLSKTLDAWFDKYQMGLRFVSPVRSSSLKFPLINFLEQLRVSYVRYRTS
ncbi:hypothetical protein C8R44DRAFT_779659 [Mycena epipterygia]|nr:hypothetical protein C8R44DRAFT_779659 [Mycena epipterygia]